MIPLYERAEIFWTGDSRKLIAVKDFHQGELIVELPMVTKTISDDYSIEISPGVYADCSFSVAGAINHSNEPNASVRKGRIIAWSCIKKGEEITINKEVK